MKKSVIALIVFGIAFGFVEAAVVYYLRNIPPVNSNLAPQPGLRAMLNLGFIAFLEPRKAVLRNASIDHAEQMREIATLVMLGAVSFLAGKNLKARLAALLISFATWDLFYYVFLHFLASWPRSLMDIDVFFLVPVPWVGPVLTPVVISAGLLAAGIILFGRAWNARQS